MKEKVRKRAIGEVSQLHWKQMTTIDWLADAVSGAVHLADEIQGMIRTPETFTAYHEIPVTPELVEKYLKTWQETCGRICCLTMDIMEYYNELEEQEAEEEKYEDYPEPFAVIELD